MKDRMEKNTRFQPVIMSIASSFDGRINNKMVAANRMKAQVLCLMFISLKL
jgi:hypothetical protein